MQGLSQFSIDAASLERLGLDSKSADRVYRAMFVYSQGLHAVLQEAVGKSKNSSQALLVLWRAFTTVLEHAGQSEEQGAESLAAIMQRGNEEEISRIENEYRGQVSALQDQTQKFSSKQRELHLEIQRLREDETRLRNDNEMYRNDHQVAMSKYEREIKQRVDAEVRFLEKTRWADALQDDLNKERKQSMHYAMQLQEANSARETVQVEVDGLRTQVKMQEAQAGAYKQAALESAQQKQRHEQQVGQYKQNLERQAQKINELKDQLEQEVEQNKRLVETNSTNQRDMRKLETQFEDENHSRKELQNERDTLRERLDKMDRETSELTDERRAMQKEINDLSMKHRTDQIELKRYTEQLERTEKSLEKIEDAHRKLVDAHRSLNVETEYLREDCQHFDEQLKKESELRKLLQHEKKQLTGQLQTLTIDRDTSQLALQSATRELQKVTEKMVKLESIVRDTKAAMTKVNLEHQVELKAHTQKVSILERVIADERNARRELVAETQGLVEKREDSLDLVKRKDLEIAELKRHRLEKEEEADRFRILLKAQEQRNTEQLVTVDKYHAAVASNDAEMRQMHVVLECEREETQRKLSELQTAYAATRQTLERKIDGWKLAYEDVLSRLNFNPATAKLGVLEIQNDELRQELKDTQAFIAGETEKIKRSEAEVTKRDNSIKELKEHKGALHRLLEESKEKCAVHVLHAERQGFARCDAEHQTERIRQNNQSFDDMKTSLETKIREGVLEIERLHVVYVAIPKADASSQVEIYTSEGCNQTDLSYQYLESSDRLQNDPRRLQRLDALQKASHFVEDNTEKSHRQEVEEHIAKKVGNKVEHSELQHSSHHLQSSGNQMQHSSSGKDMLKHLKQRTGDQTAHPSNLPEFGSNGKQMLQHLKVRTGDQTQHDGNPMQHSGKQMQRSGDQTQHGGDQMQRSGDQRQHGGQQGGNQMQHSGNQMQRSGDQRQHDVQMSQSGDQMQHSGNQMERTSSGDRRQHDGQVSHGGDQMQHSGNQMQQSGNRMEHSGNQLQRSGMVHEARAVAIPVLNKLGSQSWNATAGMSSLTLELEPEPDTRGVLHHVLAPKRPPVPPPGSQHHRVAEPWPQPPSGRAPPAARLANAQKMHGGR